MIFLATWRLAIRGQRSDLAVIFHCLGTPAFSFLQKRVNPQPESSVMKNKQIAIPPARNVARLLTLQCLFFLALSLALTQPAQAVTPAPDGAYDNGNTAEGAEALFNLTTGVDNTALGFQALFSNTTGMYNTATGVAALINNTTGGYNTANGLSALDNNAVGSANTATGYRALGDNNGNANTATGSNALLENTTGNYNTANGSNALYSSQHGNANTATGYGALYSNNADDNTANGTNALFSNTTGIYNTANGAFALQNSSVGNYNTADGLNALVQNTSGDANTAIGVSALFTNTTGSKNTAAGILALEKNTTGDSNIALGFNAGSNLTTGSNNIDIGNVGSAGESSHIRIGTEGTQTNTFIAGIAGVAVTGSAVVVNASGQLGVAPSSARFKEAIKPMDKASEAILSLKPVTFRYKEDLDPNRVPQFGLVAEEVEKVNADLVVRDEEGKAMTVRYEAVNAMLLNEFLKEHGQVQRLEATVAQQQKQIEALTTTVQKVSDQIALSKPAPQLVANP